MEATDVAREATLSIPAPEVSVLMPVHNGGRYVGEAIESILTQTLSDFEFIIMDDGSSDESIEIVRGYAQQDPRIRPIARPRAGLVAVLNEGLSLCRGEFVARMDADDISLPGRLERQSQYLRQHPRCVAVGCRSKWIDADGEVLSEPAVVETHEAIDRAHLAGRGGTIIHPAAMLRREAIERVGGYRAEFQWCEDLDLFLRLAEIGELANLNEIHFLYRQHVSSVCKQRTSEQVEIANRVLTEACARRGLARDAAGYCTGKTSAAEELYSTWAWWALSQGNLAAARKHAFACLKRAPLSLSSWRLLACALRGH